MTHDWLTGAIDLHRHGYPEISLAARTGLDDLSDLRLCGEAGMAGAVLKSHLWPTVGRTHLLNEMLDDVEVFGSITLNHAVGGLRPDMVEAAALQGARVLWLPTWSSANDIERGGFTTTLRRYVPQARPADPEPIHLLDHRGTLRPEVIECLDVASQYGMLVFSGHVSPEEAVAVAESGRTDGRFVFSHPDSNSVAAGPDAVHRVVEAGGYIEITALGTRPEIARVSPAELADVVRAHGAEHCVVSSDFFFEWAPPSSRMLADLCAGLSAAGLADADIRRMTTTNPRALLGLAPVGPDTDNSDGARPREKVEEER